jgi:hypothetical protein
VSKKIVFSDDMTRMLVKLAVHGHSASAIASMLNRSFGTVFDSAAIRYKAHAVNVLLRRATGARTLPVPISSATESALRDAARDRAMSVEKLAGELLAVLASDHLVEAVLDIPVPATRTRRPHPGKTSFTTGSQATEDPRFGGG